MSEEFLALKGDQEDGSCLPLGEALVCSSWQNRRLAWQRVGKLEEEVELRLVATAFEKEQNVSALDAALEGIETRINKLSSATEITDLLEAGLAYHLVKKGLGSARAGTRDKSNRLIESLTRFCPAECTEALVDGLNTKEERRGSGRIPTSCARLLARHPDESMRLAIKIQKPLESLFHAASADARLAAAELAIALEGRGLTFLDELGPSAKKSIERARAERDAPVNTNSENKVPQQENSLNSLNAINKEERPTEPQHIPQVVWSSTNEFWTEILQRCREQARTADEGESVTIDLEWIQLFTRNAWLARKGALEAVVVVCAERQFIDDGTRAAAALQADDLIEALSKAAASETHAKVTITAVEALAASVKLFGPDILEAVKSGIFPNIPDEEETLLTPLQRARDKRFAPALSTLLQALSHCDTWIAFEAPCVRLVASLCSTASKKRLPPHGRAVLLDWIGSVRGRSRRKLLGVEAYARLAAADANERDSVLRTAAVSALASLTLLGDLSIDSIAAANDDKRIRTKLEELIAERRTAFTRKKDTTQTKQSNLNKKSKQPLVASKKNTALPMKRPASAPGTRLASTEIAKNNTSQQRTSEPITKAVSKNKKNDTPWYPPNPRTPSAKPVSLKEIVPSSIRAALNEQKDKDSWKRRREALERIVSACSNIARGQASYLEASKEVKQLISDLRPRLADAQAKLRPIACEALAAVLYAIEPREAAARIGAKLGARAAVAAVLDSSRGVRGPALYALAACVAEASDGSVLSRALADAAPQLGSALAGNASPAAKPDLLDWLEKRAPYFPSGEISEDADIHLVPALLGLMTDKHKDCRDKSQACLGALLANRVVSTNAVTDYLRDALPAARRLLQPRIEDLWRQLEETTVQVEDEKDSFALEENEILEENEAAQNSSSSLQDVVVPAFEVKDKQEKEEVIKVSLDSANEARQLNDEVSAIKVAPAPIKTIEMWPPPPPNQSDRDTTFEERGDDEIPRFSEISTRISSEIRQSIVAPPPAPTVEADNEAKVEVEETAEVSAMFTFSAEDVEPSRPTTEVSPLDFKPEGSENTNELWTRAFNDLIEPTDSLDVRKHALKAIVYLCGLTSPPQQLNEPLQCATAAERLGKIVDDSILRLGTKPTDVSKRFVRLCVGTALTFARVARLDHVAIHALLGAATRSAAAPALESDFEIRAALNDLAVTVALETPKAHALAAVLDLLGGHENDRLVLGQLARVVHLVATVTAEEDKSPSFWDEIRRDRTGGIIQADEKYEVSEVEATLADRVLPVVISAHNFLEEAAIDHSKRLAFDAAKTVVALLTDTVGLEIILLAGKQGGLPDTSAIFQFATKLAGHDHKSHQNTPVFSHRTTHGTNAITRQKSALVTTSSLKERLNEVKQRGTTQGSPPPSITPASASLGDDAAARIAELRRRLAASTR